MKPLKVRTLHPARTPAQVYDPSYEHKYAGGPLDGKPVPCALQNRAVIQHAVPMPVQMQPIHTAPKSQPFTVVYYHRTTFRFKDLEWDVWVC